MGEKERAQQRAAEEKRRAEKAKEKATTDVADKAQDDTSAAKPTLEVAVSTGEATDLATTQSASLGKLGGVCALAGVASLVLGVWKFRRAQPVINENPSWAKHTPDS